MARSPSKQDAGTGAPRQVLLRGLAILKALNQRTISSVETIAAETGLPKPTIVRMLSLLAGEGYALRLPNRRGYMLGERALALSSGYRSHDAIVEIARPHLSRFTAEHKWPVSLATLETDTMRLRVSSSRESPFTTSGDDARMLRRVPMLHSAVGLAYLAFCPADERDTILALLRASGRAADRSARDRAYVDGLLAGIARQGFAPSPPAARDPAQGFAVPVLAARRVVASVTLRYFGKALTDREAVRRYLAPLRATANAIAEAFSAQT
ncbi:MAG: helix-turn-helix domain-containing protein [Hyphomicrobiales bacterium]|nr:helix-turn-helix domain-containing protein [Hyphomicrobiales bacterium]